MTWPTFIVYLSLIYITYYTVNLLYDLHRSKSKTSNDPNFSELFYHENVAPFAVQYEEQEALERLDIVDGATTDVSKPQHSDNSMDLKAIMAQAKSDLQELNKKI